MTAYVGPVRRRNYGRGHSYVDANGAKVPGVTGIIGDGVPKPALVNWAADTTADYAVDHWDELAEMPPSARLKTLKSARYADRDTAANKGTRVHSLAEKLVKGEQVDVPDELAGHVESYVRFLDDFNVQPILVEAVVMSHKHGYAGTLDLIADLDLPQVGGVRALLDVKTSRSGIFGETALQLAGYRYADVYLDGNEEKPLPAVQWTGAIHVRSDGYSLVPVEAGPAQHRALLYVQQVAAFTADARSLVGDAIEPPTQSAYRLTRTESAA
jgi:hypothetical protein